MAPAEAVERLSGLLEAAGGGSLTLSERGDVAAVPRHPAFRLLTAMSPATGAELSPFRLLAAMNPATGAEPCLGKVDADLL